MPRPVINRPPELLKAIEDAVRDGVSSVVCATSLGITTNQANQIANSRGLYFKGKRGRPRVADPVRKRPRTGLSGQAHYDKIDAVLPDPFNRRMRQCRKNTN